jgi:polyisoprenoid-binding protein YceI
MKRYLFFVLFLLACGAAARAADDTRAVDVKASHATFAVVHALIERVTGSVPIVAANVTLGADGGGTPIAVDATLDPAHINTGDGDRDGDLVGSDWFDTKKFPLWTFRSSRVTPNADGTFSIAGVLTVHGVGVPVTLAASLVHGGAHPAYHATTTVDRHAFGMVVTRTDVLVGNEITIVLDVQTK